MAQSSAPLLKLMTQINQDSNDIDLWSTTTLLIDRSGKLEFNDVRHLSDQFESNKDIPYANLGIRDGAVWFRVNLSAESNASKKWFLTFGYALLAKADIFLVENGVLIKQTSIGYESPISKHEKTYSMATELDIHPDHTYELFVRASTQGSMLVPMRLIEAGTYSVQNTSHHMVQGVFTGVGLCLLVYALINAAILRRRLYLAYAVSVVCMTLFLLALQGMGAEHIWGHYPWVAKNIAHLTILLNVAANLWFLHEILDLRIHAPRIALAMRVAASFSIFIIVLIFLDILNFQRAHVAASVIGQISAFITIPALWLRARAGAKGIWFVLGGWAVYTIGALFLTWTITGLISFRPWVWDLFQVTALIEMLSWFVVMGIDAKEKYKVSLSLRVEHKLMKSLAETDSLTGLPNRRALMERMKATLPDATVSAPSAVLLMDLDGFKKINDTYGHHAGDALLKEVSTRILDVLHGHDFASRLGGDEFVVLAESLAQEDHAQMLGEKLTTSFQEPFITSDGTFNVGLTVGYALCPMDGHSPTDLLRAADHALYAGKLNGKGQARRVTPEQLHQIAQSKFEVKSHPDSVVVVPPQAKSPFSPVATQLQP